MSKRTLEFVCLSLITILVLSGFLVFFQKVGGGGQAVVPKPFQIGDSVVVTNVGSAGLYVRSAPSTSASVIRKMWDGTAGKVLEGPQQADGYAWWKVQYDDGTTGWSVDQWLEKFTRPSLKFSTGQRVKTTASLKVRSTPCYYKNDVKEERTDNIIKIMPAGSYGTIQDFPEPRPRVVDSYNWYYIKYDDGTTGWSADVGLEAVPGVTSPTISKTFSVLVKQGQSVEDTIVISNPNDVKITVKTFTITDYGGFKGTVTCLTSLPFDIPAKGNGEIRVRITAASDCTAGTFTIKYKITGDPNNWEVLGD